MGDVLLWPTRRNEGVSSDEDAEPTGNAHPGILENVKEALNGTPIGAILGRNAEQTRAILLQILQGSNGEDVNPDSIRFSIAPINIHAPHHQEPLLEINFQTRAGVESVVFVDQNTLQVVYNYRNATKK